MQALLVSAITAAVVTLMIEYSAKPHLEARKDRIVEERRLRREWMAQLRQLGYRILNRVTLTHLKTWKIDQPALGELAAKSGELYEGFLLLLAPRIDKRRRRVAGELIVKLDVALRGLAYMDAIQKEHGISPERLPDGGRVILDHIAREIDKIFTVSSGVLAVLSLSRRRPWFYYSQLRYWSKWAKSNASRGGGGVQDGERVHAPGAVPEPPG
jgi:hypothetical protein